MHEKHRNEFRIQLQKRARRISELKVEALNSRRIILEVRQLRKKIFLPPTPSPFLCHENTLSAPLFMFTSWALYRRRMKELAIVERFEQCVKYS